jgi:hypothetical protein
VAQPDDKARDIGISPYGAKGWQAGLVIFRGLA